MSFAVDISLERRLVRLRAGRHFKSYKSITKCHMEQAKAFLKPNKKKRRRRRYFSLFSIIVIRELYL